MEETSQRPWCIRPLLLLLIPILFCAAKPKAFAADCLTRQFDEVMDGECLNSACTQDCPSLTGGNGPHGVIAEILPHQRDEMMAAPATMTLGGCQFLFSSLSPVCSEPRKSFSPAKSRQPRNSFEPLGISGLVPLNRGRA